eukprot:m.222741 g.222741  ORF g.222741 m.222741 type:complete len:229 (+) comp10818_c0_seq1:34-720(+)
MAASSDEISALLASTDRYNPKELDRLVTFFRKTAQDNTYNLDVNLAILKLYQFYPEKYDAETTKAVLLKSLSSLPDSHFLLCLYLLSEEKLADAGIASLRELHRLLESCLFSEFWAYLGQHGSVLQTKVLIGAEHVPAEIAGFQERVREYIAHIVPITYQTIPVAILAPMLGGLDAAKLAAFAEAHGWKITGDTVFVKNQEDQIKSKNIVENISFKSLGRLMVSSYKN